MFIFFITRKYHVTHKSQQFNPFRPNENVYFHRRYLSDNTRHKQSLNKHDLVL